MLRDHIKGRRFMKAELILGAAEVSVAPYTIVLSTCLLCLIVAVLRWTKLCWNEFDQCYRFNAAGQKINQLFINVHG